MSLYTEQEWTDAHARFQAKLDELAIEVAALKADRDFWDRKAGEEHANVQHLLDTCVPVAELMCDCGARVTVCASCAVADYQAANPGCATCCPPIEVKEPR